MKTRAVRIAVLGCGTVGAAVVRGLAPPWQLQGVAVRTPTKARDCQVSPAVVSTSALTVAQDPDADVVVEVMGGVEPRAGGSAPFRPVPTESEMCL